VFAGILPGWRTRLRQGGGGAASSGAASSVQVAKFAATSGNMRCPTDRAE